MRVVPSYFCSLFSNPFWTGHYLVRIYSHTHDSHCIYSKCEHSPVAHPCDTSLPGPPGTGRCQGGGQAGASPRPVASPPLASPFCAPIGDCAATVQYTGSTHSEFLRAGTRVDSSRGHNCRRYNFFGCKNANMLRSIGTPTRLNYL